MGKEISREALILAELRNIRNEALKNNDVETFMAVQNQIKNSFDMPEDFIQPPYRDYERPHNNDIERRSYEAVPKLREETLFRGVPMQNPCPCQNTSSPSLEMVKSFEQ